ncbi:MAG: hypothetical protein MHPSP_001177 [Paramarteilia canceri]
MKENQHLIQNVNLKLMLNNKFDEKWNDPHYWQERRKEGKDFEANRNSRIFDEKKRLFGRDINFLKNQCEQNRSKKMTEKKENEELVIHELKYYAATYHFKLRNNYSHNLTGLKVIA